MAFGLMMLAMSCACSYFYFYHIRPNQLSAETTPDGSQLAKAAEEIKAAASLSGAKTISDMQVGDFVKISDLGLSLSEIDGRVEKKDLFKSGLNRWHELVVGDGSTSVLVSCPIQGRDDFVFVGLKKTDLSNIGKRASDFASVEVGYPGEVTFEGSVLHYSHSFPAQHCPDEDELAAQTCLIWNYQDESGLQMLSVTRWQDHSLSVFVKTKVMRSQIAFLSR